MGLSVSAQSILSDGVEGTSLTVDLGWGFAVSIAIYTSGGVSDAHLNPAVTLAFAAFRAFPKRKIATFVLAQLLGAFCGAALMYANFGDAFDDFDARHSVSRVVYGPFATANAFATYPAPFVGIGTAFFDEVLATASKLAHVLTLCRSGLQLARAGVFAVFLPPDIVTLSLICSAAVADLCAERREQPRTGQQPQRAADGFRCHPAQYELRPADLSVSSDRLSAAWRAVLLLLVFLLHVVGAGLA